MKRAADDRIGFSNKGDRTRTDILDAAAGLFVRLGVAGTTMREIAAAAGVKRPTFYYYFQSKDDILRALVTESTEEAAREVTAASNAGGSCVQRLERCVHALVLWILEHRTRFIVADRNEGSLPPQLAERHASGKRLVLKVFEDLLSKGIDCGEMRPIDVQIVSLSIIGMSAWTAWWFNDSGRASKASVAAAVADTAVAAVAQKADKASRGSLPSAIAAVRRELDHLERSTGAL